MQITKQEVFSQVNHAQRMGQVRCDEIFALSEGFESDNPRLQIMQAMVETGEISREELTDFADDLSESEKELDLMLGALPVILTGVSNGN